MAPNIIERIQAKIELFRLEQRYTRRRNRRSTFVSNAVYIDGEYVYQTPNATGSSTGSSNSAGSRRVDALHFEEPLPGSEDMGHPAQQTTSAGAATSTPPARKRLSRFASMPGFGSAGAKEQSSQGEWRNDRR